MGTIANEKKRRAVTRATPRVLGNPRRDGGAGTSASILARIREAVRRTNGVDLSEYKAPTFERRLARRMALRGVATHEAYLELLEADGGEIAALCDDALIGVTSFFRDPEVFEALKRDVVPRILEGGDPATPVRIWCAGCSTGEEVYSLAILFLEYQQNGASLSAARRRIQLFGSDVNHAAIERARRGLYGESAVRGVGEARRKSYFTKGNDGYRVKKTLRELCVFVQHDLARNPAFSRLDLVSCRNVLIYFEQPLLERVVAMLHHCLLPQGFLLLGHTENVLVSSRLFSASDKANRIYRRTEVPSAPRVTARADARFAPVTEPALGDPNSAEVARRLDRLFLSRYAPPGVLVNGKLEVLQFRGDTGDFLRPAVGAPTNDLASLAREGLMPALHRAVVRAARTTAPVRIAGVEVGAADARRTCDLVVLPYAASAAADDRLFIVVFEPPRLAAGHKKGAGPSPRLRPDERARLAWVEQELAATRDYLQAAIAEHAGASVELSSTNQELTSANEELQTINEELEAAKEELQATNEELSTSIEQLRSRESETDRANRELVSLLGAVDVPLVVLDGERRIRRFTPRARDILRVVPSDVGRPVGDIRPNIEVSDLDQRIATVIATMGTYEAEVQDREGCWYRIRIRPHRAPDEKIDGAMLSLVDIDAVKQKGAEIQEARAEAERAHRTRDQFLATLSHELRTPVATMLMYAQLLRRDDVDPKVRRVGEMIERGTRAQVQMIDDLLDVSRIAIGKLSMSREAVDLGAVVATAADAVAAPAQEKGLTFVASCDPAVGQVLGDAGRLEHVVTNLLTNAIKFTPRGGRVTLTLDAADGGARLRVTDTGAGIAPEFLPHVFERFSQEDANASRVHGGLGLGLAIVKHVVERHRGTVVAESLGPKRGATFTIRLPTLAVGAALGVPPAPARRRPSTGPAAWQKLLGARILVVDDNADAREALASMLEVMGAIPRAAESAAAAMVALHEFRPQLVICDIAMPDEDGYSFVRRMRALGPTLGGDVPALALTAFAAAEDRGRALTAGFQMHLAKPVEIDRLADAATELLERGPPPSSERRTRSSRPPP